MDDDHGIAIKGVSRGSFSVDDAVRPFVAFHIAVLSLREDPALAPKTQIFINGDGEVCFGSDAQEECLRDFWGLDGKSGAELYEPWFRVDEATSPRGKGIQMSLLFLGVPETVEQATIEFGEHRIPIDLGSGMTGQVPTYDYKLHYAEFAVGSVLYDSNHKKVVLEKTLIQEPHGTMILVFSAENGSDTTEFVPVIELAGSRVSKSGVMFDGVFHPTKGWTPKTVRIEGGILSPGQRSVFEHSIPIGPGDDDAPWGPICFSLDPAKRTGGVLMQFTVSEPLSGTATTVSEASYLDYPLNEKVGCSPGSLLWRYPLGYPSPVTPAISGGVVYSGEHEGFLHVLDAETGDELWFHPTGDSIRDSATATGGRVYVGSDDGFLYAVDAGSGSLLWRFQTGGYVYSPTVSGGVVYVGSHDNHFYAVDADTGRLLWSFETGAHVNSKPAVHGSMVYVGSEDGYLYALDTDIGALVWQREIGNYSRPSPSVHDGVVYIGSEITGHVVALDADSGRQQWRSSRSSSARDFRTGGLLHPVLSGGMIYTWNRVAVVALDAATGEQSWQSWVGRNLYPPVVSGGVVYAGSYQVLHGGSYEASLLAIDAETGDRLWSYATGDEVAFTPAVADGVVYMEASDETGDHYLFAIVAEK